jgi:DNA processing protein
VVEAKEKSGSLSAAQWAKKQERKIFSVPGNIYFSNSRGTNFLIKNGAILTETAKDILKELKIA